MASRMKPAAVALGLSLGAIAWAGPAHGQSPWGANHRQTELARLSGDIPELRVASRDLWSGPVQTPLAYGSLWQGYAGEANEHGSPGPWSPAPPEVCPPRRPVLTFVGTWVDRIYHALCTPWERIACVRCRIAGSLSACHSYQMVLRDCGCEPAPALPALPVPTPAPQVVEETYPESPQPLYEEPRLVAPPPLEPEPSQLVVPTPQPTSPAPEPAAPAPQPVSPAPQVVTETPQAPAPDAPPSEPAKPEPALSIPLQPPGDVIEVPPIPIQPAPPATRVIIRTPAAELPATPIQPADPAPSAAPTPLRSGPVIDLVPDAALPGEPIPQKLPRRNTIPSRNDKPPRNAIPTR